MRCLDLQSMSERYSMRLASNGWSQSVDGQTLFAVREQLNSGSFAERLFGFLGLRWPVPTRIVQRGQFIDASSGVSLGTVTVRREDEGLITHDVSQVYWSPNSEVAAIHDKHDNSWAVWDIPPRKSLTWFAAGAALLALPIAFLARRRVRRLRSLPA